MKLEIYKKKNKRKKKLEKVLKGQETIIKEIIGGNMNNRIRIVNAPETISNDEEPVKAVRSKKSSSMVVGVNMVKKCEADAFISAGNTGALMAAALLYMGRIQGIDRPALAPVIPTIKGRAMLIDAGSNTDCKPNNLLQSAIMGSAYMNTVMNIKSP